MKSKTSASARKPSVAVRDLQAKKNPKGGAPVNTTRSNKKHASLTAPAAGGGYSK